MRIRHAPMIPVSWGELIDKITILELKRKKIGSQLARDNIERELTLLLKLYQDGMDETVCIKDLKRDLEGVNDALWNAEDSLREKEAKNIFDAEFVELARSVYKLNDKRFEIKQRLNAETASELIEERSIRNIRDVR
jgi:hypothetical protein